MLDLHKVFLTLTRGGDSLDLLHDISFRAPTGHLMAIVGASGCGKTTLLKTIAGLVPETSGEVRWNERNLATEGDLLPNEFAYVPQFSIAYDPLTVEESVESAVRLRVRCQSRAEEDSLIERALDVVGLSSIAERRVKVISGGQKRRLGLAMELVAGPSLLLCDEVTSGLDPKTEQEIVHLMHALSRKEKRLVINVTHSLAHIDLHDSILVMHGGCLAYHGPPRLLTHYFSVQHPEEVYRRLADREPRHWHASWVKHRAFYYGRMRMAVPDPALEAAATIEHATTPLEEATRGPESTEATATITPETESQTESTIPGNPADSSPVPETSATTTLEGKSDPDMQDAEAQPATEKTSSQKHGPPDSVPRTPGLLAQTLHLVARRWKIFFRDRTQLILHISILFGFPALVMLFALNAPAEPKVLSGSSEVSGLQHMAEQRDVFLSQLESGGFASGLIMFQVILLTLMGSNNSAREIAGERMIFEKEKLAGLRPLAYLISKVFFLVVPVMAQAIWMGVFVQFFWPFRGEISSHLVSLLCVTGAMTSICLGISANMRSADQANLLSVYLVGFQLPLSGIVLALPGAIEPLVRPFIAAYWSWSASVSSLGPAYFNAVDQVTKTAISPGAICLFVLGLHLVLGVFATYIGARRNFWE